MMEENIKCLTKDNSKLNKAITENKNNETNLTETIQKQNVNNTFLNGETLSRTLPNKLSRKSKLMNYRVNAKQGKQNKVKAKWMDHGLLFRFCGCHDCK